MRDEQIGAAIVSYDGKSIDGIISERDVQPALEAKQPSLLVGLIFDESGERLTPSHAVKKGTRYRYYVSRSLIVGTAKDKSTGRRIPAANIETLVITNFEAFSPMRERFSM